MSTGVVGHQPRAPLLEPDVAGPPYAPWIRRVLAYLIDTAAVTGVSFLAGVRDATFEPIPFVVSDPSGQVGGSPPLLAWGALLGILTLQAYTGASPGKWALGVAVVRDDDGRPIGLLSTILRELVHILDAILLIGFLRPLWNPERRTFADSIMRTYVLRTRRPHLHPWLVALQARRRVRARAGGGPDVGPITPEAWTGVPTPRGESDPPTGDAPPFVWWEARPAPYGPFLTAVTVVALFVGAVFGLPIYSAGSTSAFSESCTVPSAGNPDTAVTMREGSLDSTGWTSRRGWVTYDEPSETLLAGWEFRGDLAEARSVVLRATFAAPDGTGVRVVERPLARTSSLNLEPTEQWAQDGWTDGGAVAGPTEGPVVVDATVTHASMWLDPTLVQGLGDDPVWKLTMVVDGVASLGCGSNNPVESPSPWG